MSLKLTKAQLITAIVDFLSDQSKDEYKTCRFCNTVYLPLPNDPINISNCLRCQHPTASSVDFLDIKKGV